MVGLRDKEWDMLANKSTVFDSNLKGSEEIEHRSRSLILESKTNMEYAMTAIAIYEHY